MKDSLTLLLNLMLGLLEQHLEGIQDFMKLGMWNASLLRPYGSGNSLTKAFEQLLYEGFVNTLLFSCHEYSLLMFASIKLMQNQ